MIAGKMMFAAAGAGLYSSSSSSAIFMFLRPPTMLSFNAFHVTPPYSARRFPGFSSFSSPRLRGHSRKSLPKQQPKKPSKFKLNCTNDNEYDEISRAKEILGVVSTDTEYNKERHDDQSKSKQEEEQQLQKKKNAFEEWLDNKLASGDLAGNSSGKEKWVQLDKAKRKFYEKRRRRTYGTDSEDEAATAGDDEKYIELKPEIVEFKSFHAKEEELYFYDAFCFPWEKDRHYRMIRKLEQKYYPDQGLEKAFIDPDEPLKPDAHKPKPKILNKIAKNVHSKENNDSVRNEAEQTPSIKISEEDGDALLPKRISSQTGKIPVAATPIDSNSDDSDMKALSEKKKKEGVQQFVKSLRSAGTPNLDGATAGEAMPYFLTSMSELPARWDGPSGTMLLIDKPKGWTSFTVCGKLRRLIKVEKVGHAGTLDPMATGLLIVCVGKATKQLQSFQDMIKVYSGVFRLGEATSTWDADSPVIERQPWEHIKDDDIQKAVTSFYGEVWQVPPMFSAIKVGGEKMYNKARRGETIDLPPRKVLIYEFDVQRSLDDGQNLIFKVTCSKGTYVRSLCADFGRALGSCAHLTSLRRDQIGDYSVADAWKFLELENEIAKHYI